MILRRVSHQTYQQFKTNNLNKNTIQVKKQLKHNTFTNEETNEITISDFDIYGQGKQLISHPKNNRQHFSPIMKKHNLIIDTQNSKNSLSLSREKHYLTNSQIKWDQNHSGNNQSILIKNNIKEDKQFQICKGSLDKLNKGVKIQKDIDNFIKQKNQQTQTINDNKIQKLSKIKKNQKIIIEYELENINEQQNNEKSIQVDIQIKNIEQQKNHKEENNIKETHPLLPIHIRYSYEQQLKNVKIKENQQIQQPQIEQKITKDKIEQFLAQQSNFLKKKTEYFEKEYAKKLWEVQQQENECQFKPILNEQSSRIFENKQKGKKFEQRQEQFQQKKQQFIEDSQEQMQPSFVPIISKKSKKIIEKQELTRNSHKSNQDNLKQRIKTKE